MLHLFLFIAYNELLFRAAFFVWLKTKQSEIWIKIAENKIAILIGLCYNYTDVLWVKGIVYMREEFSLCLRLLF